MNYDRAKNSLFGAATVERGRERMAASLTKETTELLLATEARLHPTSSRSNNPILLNMNARLTLSALPFLPLASFFLLSSPPPSFLFPCKCMCAQKARPARSGGPDAGTVGGWQLAMAMATTEEQYVCTGFSCWDGAFVKPNRLCPTFLRLGMQYACFSLEASLIIPAHRCFTFVQQTNHQSVGQ